MTHGVLVVEVFVVFLLAGGLVGRARDERLNIVSAVVIIVLLFFLGIAMAIGNDFPLLLGLALLIATVLRWVKIDDGVESEQTIR